MKFTIRTTKMQEMVSKSARGAGNNKLIPLTGLLGMKLESGKLTLTTTDATNYLYIIEDEIEGDDFNITIPVEIFLKLVSKTTSEYVELTADDSKLTVKGNGKYTIGLPLDENGKPIKYPDPMSKFAEDEYSQEVVKYVDIAKILTTLKSALSISVGDDPCYSGYYVGDRVVATDTYKIAALNTKLLEQRALISSDLMSLLSVMSTDTIDVYRKDNKFVFKTDNCIIYGFEMEGIDDYAIDAISGLVESEFTSFCKIEKADILQLLDRLSLFVSPYDKNNIGLEFTQDGIAISSKSSSGAEIIQYQESSNFQPFKCLIDITMLIQEIKSIPFETLTIYYGLDSSIKIVCVDITIVIALAED